MPPSLHFTLPPSSLFQLPPYIDPTTLASPPAGSSFIAPPFTIPPHIYNSALDFKIPITIATVYAATVLSLNAYNKSRANKPWPISKTASFFWFVVAHNIFLAVYSAWTFIGMLNAIRRTLSVSQGLAGFADSLCQMHGTSGLGNAINPSEALPTDEGRLWNEGLAFYGWLFYLSKFYEVLDTAIIIAKGKKSSTLQTYHHAGAMMCMWAGVRFMSSPIWMFVFINSAIHAMMYTYYTLTAFSIPIPTRIKRSLTTMQIIQFLVGVVYAGIHSFITYDIPIQVPTMSTKITEAASGASAAATAGVGALLKKLLFRAAGEEGVAENVHGAYEASTLASLKQKHHKQPAQTFHTEYQTISCVNTPGQTFAIWLNVLYLAPLTVLFVRFFIRSYLRRSGQRTEPKRIAEDAVKGADRAMNGNNAGNENLKGGHMNGNGQAKKGKK